MEVCVDGQHILGLLGSPSNVQMLTYIIFKENIN